MTTEDTGATAAPAGILPGPRREGGCPRPGGGRLSLMLMGDAPRKNSAQKYGGSP